MATVNITFDTKTKELDISINGSKLDNVSNVFIDRYVYDGKPESHIEISMVDHVEEDDIRVVTRIMASDLDAAKSRNKDSKDIKFEKIVEYDPITVGAYALLGKKL